MGIFRIVFNKLDEHLFRAALTQQMQGQIDKSSLSNKFSLWIWKDARIDNAMRRARKHMSEYRLRTSEAATVPGDILKVTQNSEALQQKGRLGKEKYNLLYRFFQPCHKASFERITSAIRSVLKNDNTHTHIYLLERLKSPIEFEAFIRTKQLLRNLREDIPEEWFTDCFNLLNLSSDIPKPDLWLNQLKATYGTQEIEFIKLCFLLKTRGSLIAKHQMVFSHEEREFLRKVQARLQDINPGPKKVTLSNASTQQMTPRTTKVVDASSPDALHTKFIRLFKLFRRLF